MTPPLLNDYRMQRYRSGLIVPPSEPPPPPPGWGDGQSFLNRPLQSTQILLSGQSNIVIENLRFENRPYVAGQGNNHVCIRLSNCTNITIRHCDFFVCAEPVAAINCSNITMEWCRALDIPGPSQPRTGFNTGNFFQGDKSHGSIVRNNKIVVRGRAPGVGGTGDTEDIISFYGSNNCINQFNQFDGRGWYSTNGTGSICGDGGGSNNLIADNTYLYPGQVGVAIAGGSNNRIERNVIYQFPSSKGNLYVANSWVPLYAINFAGGAFTGNRVTDNRYRWWDDWSGAEETAHGEFQGDTVVSGNIRDTSINPTALEVVL